MRRATCHRFSKIRIILGPRRPEPNEKAMIDDHSKSNADDTLDVDLTTGEIIPEDQRKEYKTPEAEKAGSLDEVSRAASGDSAGDNPASL